jgi:hypothetical protein
MFLRFKGWFEYNTFIMQICWFDYNFVGVKVVVHENDHGEVLLNHATEDLD